MARPTVMLLIATQSILQAGLAPAARAVTPVDPAEVHRGVALVGSWTSDEPALRLERQTHTPSPSFGLGAALGAWIGATAILDYDLKTPTGDGGDAEALDVDCYDERVAFAHLEARRQSLELTPSQATTAAGVADPKVSPLWTTRRQDGRPAGCR